MAATTTPADKKRKQLYVIAGLGAVLAVLVAIQAPKFLGGGSEAAPASTSDSVPAADDARPDAGFSQGAVLAGVTFVPSVAPRPGEGQLASFSLFDRRDPFVQLVKESTEGASQDGEPAGVKVSNGGTAGSGAAASASGSAGASSSSTGPAALTSATIWVNGTEESVDVKKRFPKADPTFVLVSLKDKVARIGVAGGAFTGGTTIALKMGQTLTLVNTATGARYTLRLLYTGDQPEQVQQFTQAQK